MASLSTMFDLENLDILLLQEVRMSSLQIENELTGFNAVVNIDHNNVSLPGTAIVWRKDIPVNDVIALSPCRLQVATVGPYVIINLYAPSGSSKKHERNIFYSQDVFTALHLHKELSIVIGGDYNCLLQPEDVENGFGFTQKNCPALANLVNVAGLHDAFRLLYPFKNEFTFFRSGCSPSRLDRFYVSSNIKNAVINVNHITTLSDNC